jgi:hypothetical protein
VTHDELIITVAGAIFGLVLLAASRRVRRCWRCGARHRAVDRCVPYDPV